MITTLDTVTHRTKRDRVPLNTEAITWKQMTIRIPIEVHKALKIRAVEEEKTVGEVVERLIREYLVKGARREG